MRTTVHQAAADLAQVCAEMRGQRQEMRQRVVEACRQKSMMSTVREIEGVATNISLTEKAAFRNARTLLGRLCFCTPSSAIVDPGSTVLGNVSCVGYKSQTAFPMRK